MTIVIFSLLVSARYLEHAALQATGRQLHYSGLSGSDNKLTQLAPANERSYWLISLNRLI